MKHTIKVEQRHIDAGQRRNGNCCMVALAVSEALNRDVAVSARYLWSMGTGRILLPPQASEAIDKFDDGQDVEPFEFEIELESTQ